MGNALEGKVAIVTGSGQGVGRGIAVFLAKEGAKVITNNRKPKRRETIAVTETFRSLGVEKEPQFSEEEYREILALRGDAESTAEEIRMNGGIAEPFYGDVADPETAKNMVAFAMEKFGRIDIVVNNAAGLGFGPFVLTDEASWDYQVNGKLKGTYNILQQVVPVMIRQGSGTILNGASDAWRGIANLTAYSAANGAIVAMTKALAKELYRFGITVNAYCPQAASPGHLSFNATLREMLAEKGMTMDMNNEKVIASNKEHGPAENVGPFLAYLCTEAGRKISGAVFEVTGGGRVSLYPHPEICAEIRKEEAPWTVEEITETVPETLFKDYVSIVSAPEF